MAQYIDKAAIVEKIEKRFDEYSSSILRHYDACTEARASELGKILVLLNTLEVKEVVDLEKSIDVDSMVTEYLKQYEEAGQTPFAMNIIGSAYRKGLEDMFRLKAQKGE